MANKHPTAAPAGGEASASPDPRRAHAAAILLRGALEAEEATSLVAALVTIGAGPTGHTVRALADTLEARVQNMAMAISDASAALAASPMDAGAADWRPHVMRDRLLAILEAKTLAAARALASEAIAETAPEDTAVALPRSPDSEAVASEPAEHAAQVTRFAKVVEILDGVHEDEALPAVSFVAGLMQIGRAPGGHTIRAIAEALQCHVRNMEEGIREARAALVAEAKA
jgi:hypothetical protein